MRKIRKFETKFVDHFTIDEDDNENLTSDQKLENKTIKDKKAEILGIMNEQTNGQSLTIDSV